MASGRNPSGLPVGADPELRSLEEWAAGELNRMQETRDRQDASLVGRLRRGLEVIDPKPVPRPSHNHPRSSAQGPHQEMRPVPKTVDALKVEVERMKLLEFDQREKLQQPRGKLIGSIYQSWRVGRPIGHVFLIILGESGVGKSSTVNHLLNKEVAAISDIQSETRSTTEHVLVGPDRHLAASDMSLSVVDVPGFNDTEGLEQDARNLVTIDKFYKEHPSLMGKAYPNIILVTLLSTDTRFQGKQSRFMKCLRAIQRLKLVDRMNPNVVVVITRACAIAPRHMREKKAKIKEIMFQTLHVEAPITCIENMPMDYDLEQVGDYTRLPSGELQPANLFDSMICITRQSGDEFAQHCLSTFFSPESTSCKVNIGQSVQANTAGLTDTERNILATLREDLDAQEFVPEVVQLIDAFIKTGSLLEEERVELNGIKYDLADNLKMTMAADVRSFSIGQLCQLLRRPPSPAVEAHLRSIFTLRQDCVMPGVVHELGKGFNIISDTLCPTPIFRFETAEEFLMETHFGTLLPPGVIMQPIRESGTYMEKFEDEKSYVENRLKQLNIDMAVDPRLFKMKARPGLNKASGAYDKGTSFLFEYRLFKLGIDGWHDIVRAARNSTFAANVNSLPENFSRNKNKGEFQDFFNTWGHFVVIAAYGGGNISISMSLTAGDNTLAEKRDLTCKHLSEPKKILRGKKG